ncbi:MAG: hypothetical protein WBE78_14085 [Candidatus Binataceae bacterium]
MPYFQTRSPARRTHRAIIALRVLALLAPPLILALGLGIGWAQLPAPNPLVVPPLPPSPPAQLPAPVTTAVAPSVLAIPALPSPYSTPGARTFNCTCSGPASATHWMGQVTSANSSSAEQSASGACVSYGEGKPPPFGTAGGIGAANGFGSLPGAEQNAGAAKFFGSPGVASSTGSSSSISSLPATAQSLGAANSFGSPQAALSFTSAEQQRLCSRCVCD